MNPTMETAIVTANMHISINAKKAWLSTNPSVCCPSRRFGSMVVPPRMQDRSSLSFPVSLAE